MPTVTWDASFEAAPSDSDGAKYGASKIRELKVAVSERGEVEHDFKATGKHLPGRCAVCYRGATAVIAALSSPPEHALAYDTTLKVIKSYAAGWNICDLDHGQFSGLSDDDHPQYLALNKASQTIAQNVACGAGVTLDGVDLSAHAAGTAMAQHVAGAGDHTHESTGAQGGKIGPAAITGMFKTGEYTGDGVAGGQAITGVGFQATILFLISQSTPTSYLGVKTNQDGLYAWYNNTYVVDQIVSFGADGFTVKGNFNTSGVTYTYIAIKHA